ncbi:MAG: glycosyltransferase family 2 protein [Ruminococcus sp.]|jgi:glycosyltransferase involved in cell wall biosynthesis|nr:glycosyltransferase family 2 protein [Ruminococcus sp.]
MFDIAVIIPCFNEEQTIKKVTCDIRKNLPDAAIFIYDNNSTDQTAQIVRKMQKTDPKLFLKTESSQGKGCVIRRAFREIDADTYVMIDGDDTYAAEYAPRLAELVENGADMAIGDRISSGDYGCENKRRFHSFGNAFVKKAVNLIFRAEIDDLLTGFRAFSYEFVKTFPVTSRGFEIETEITVHALDNRLSVKQIPVGYRDRPEGSFSKLSTVKDGIKVIRKIVSLFENYRPLLFFGILAGILMAAALALFLPVLGDYLATSAVARFPTLIVSGFSALCAVLLFTAGLILSSLHQKARREFEINFINSFSEKRQKKGI